MTRRANRKGVHLSGFVKAGRSELVVGSVNESLLRKKPFDTLADKSEVDATTMTECAPALPIYSHIFGCMLLGDAMFSFRPRG